MKVQRGFISLGAEGQWLNILVIDQEKSYLDKRFNKVAVIDIYGTRYNVDKHLVDGKISYRT